MADTDTTRRLMRLKKRPTMAGRSDDYLEMMLEDALEFFREYTHGYANSDLGSEIDGLICEIAVFNINQEGVENVSSASEGAMSRSYFDSVPPMLARRLNKYRRVLGLDSPPPVETETETES